MGWSSGGDYLDGYTRIRDVKRNVYRWVDSDDMEHYSIKDYELA